MMRRSPKLWGFWRGKYLRAAKPQRARAVLWKRAAAILLLAQETTSKFLRAHLDNQEQFAKDAMDLLAQFYEIDAQDPNPQDGDEDEAREGEEDNPQNAEDGQEESASPALQQVADADMMDDDSDAQDSVDGEDFEGEGTEGDQTPDPSQRPEHPDQYAAPLWRVH